MLRDGTEEAGQDRIRSDSGVQDSQRGKLSLQEAWTWARRRMNEAYVNFPSFCGRGFRVGEDS